MSGITNTLLLGNKINLKTSAGISYTKNGYNEDFIENDYSISKNYKDNYIVRKWLFNSTLNYKFSNRLNVRAGVIGNLIDFNYYQLSAEHEITSSLFVEISNGQPEDFTEHILSHIVND